MLIAQLLGQHSRAAVIEHQAGGTRFMLIE